MSLNKNLFYNDIYFKKNRYKEPKENFKLLIKILKKEKFYNKGFSLLDVGCSNGELLFNLNKNFNNSSLVGIDVDKSLLKKAKIFCPKNISFLHKNIAKKNLKIGKFDIIVCSGVLSIFKNIDIILKNLLANLKPSGKIFIFDSCNKYGFNLFIKSEYYSKNKKKTFYKNVYSVEYLKNFFKKYKKKLTIYPFELKINLKKKKKFYPIYTWTEKLSNRKIVTSGLGIIQYQYWFKFY